MIGFIRAASSAVLGLLLVLAPPAEAGPGAPVFSVDSRVALHGYRALTEAELGGALLALQAVSSTEDARSVDWARVGRPLKRLSNGLPPGTAVWFARPDGSYFTVEAGLTGANVSDRSYFPGLMAGREVEGELVVSRSTGRKSVVVAAPVVKDGAVVGAVGVSLPVEALSAQIDEQLKPSPGLVLYALDAQGRTALHQQAALMFEFPSEIGSPSLREAVRVMLGSSQGTVSYTFRGVRKTVVFERSAVTGWVFALGLQEGPARSSRGARLH